MKPYDDLSYRGLISRLRKQAQAALEAYGLTKAKVKFLNYSGNTAYQIDTRNISPPEPADGRYWENHYFLRLHQWRYQTFEAIQSEMQWLGALCRDTELVVPEPVPTQDGTFVTITAVPGIPEPQYATLLRWVKGRELTKNIQSQHFHALGRMIATLHNHTSQWQPPKGFYRQQHDWDGLFWDGGLFRFPARELWANIPKKYQDPFTKITTRVREVMEILGKGPDVYGLIHADLYIDGNVLWNRGEIRPVDFDDTAFGYWIDDLAVPLSAWQDNEVKGELKAALLKGYQELRSISTLELEHLDLFIGARYAVEMLYAVNAMLAVPKWAESGRRWLNEAAGNLIKFLSNNQVIP
ncbi:MAG: phosphotransferase enzyme family protein [Candidatus Hermodarchaeota archaeon]